MNRKKAALYVFLCFSLISVLFTQLYFSYDSKESNNSEISYIIREIDGRIAVFSDSELIDITDIDTRFLPENDRNELKNGIEISSRQELYRLLEDFSG